MLLEFLEFTNKYFPLTPHRLDKKNDNIKVSKTGNIVKTIQFSPKSKWEIWKQNFQLEIERQHQLSISYPNHILQIINWTVEVQQTKVVIYLTFNCNNNAVSLYYFLQDSLIQSEQKIIIAEQLLEIAYILESSKIQHRNIKLNNFIIFDSKLFITDFGSARTHYETYTKQSTTTLERKQQCQTLFYNSPEILEIAAQENNDFQEQEWKALFQNEQYQKVILTRNDNWAISIVLLQLINYNIEIHDDVKQYYGYNIAQFDMEIKKIFTISEFKLVGESIKKLSLGKIPASDCLQFFLKGRLQQTNEFLDERNEIHSQSGKVENIKLKKNFEIKTVIDFLYLSKSQIQDLEQQFDEEDTKKIVNKIQLEKFQYHCAQNQNFEEINDNKSQFSDSSSFQICSPKRPDSMLLSQVQLLRLANETIENLGKKITKNSNIKVNTQQGDQLQSLFQQKDKNLAFQLQKQQKQIVENQKVISTTYEESTQESSQKLHRLSKNKQEHTRQLAYNFKEDSNTSVQQLIQKKQPYDYAKQQLSYLASTEEIIKDKNQTQNNLFSMSLSQFQPNPLQNKFSNLQYVSNKLEKGYDNETTVPIRLVKPISIDSFDDSSKLVDFHQFSDQSKKLENISEPIIKYSPIERINDQTQQQTKQKMIQLQNVDSHQLQQQQFDIEKIQKSTLENQFQNLDLTKLVKHSQISQSNTINKEISNQFSLDTTQNQQVLKKYLQIELDSQRVGEETTTTATQNAQEKMLQKQVKQKDISEQQLIQKQEISDSKGENQTLNTILDQAYQKSVKSIPTCKDQRILIFLEDPSLNSIPKLQEFFNCSRDEIQQCRQALRKLSENIDCANKEQKKYIEIIEQQLIKKEKISQQLEILIQNHEKQQELTGQQLRYLSSEQLVTYQQYLSDQLNKGILTKDKVEIAEQLQQLEAFNQKTLQVQQSCQFNLKIEQYSSEEKEHQLINLYETKLLGNKLSQKEMDTEIQLVEDLISVEFQLNRFLKYHNIQDLLQSQQIKLLTNQQVEQYKQALQNMKQQNLLQERKDISDQLNQIDKIDKLNLDLCSPQVINFSNQQLQEMSLGQLEGYLHKLEDRANQFQGDELNSQKEQITKEILRVKEIYNEQLQSFQTRKEKQQFNQNILEQKYQKFVDLPQQSNLLNKIEYEQLSQEQQINYEKIVIQEAITKNTNLQQTEKQQLYQKELLDQQTFIEAFKKAQNLILTQKFINIQNSGPIQNQSLEVKKQQQRSSIPARQLSQQDESTPLIQLETPFKQSRQLNKNQNSFQLNSSRLFGEEELQFQQQLNDLEDFEIWSTNQIIRRFQVWKKTQPSFYEIPKEYYQIAKEGCCRRRIETENMIFGGYTSENKPKGLGIMMKKEFGAIYEGVFDQGKFLYGLVLELNGQKQLQKFIGYYHQEKLVKHGRCQITWFKEDIRQKTFVIEENHQGPIIFGYLVGNATRWNYKEKWKYIGEWKQSLRSGIGKLFILKDNDAFQLRYDGEFAQNTFHGQGKYFYNLNLMEEGSYFMGKRTGVHYLYKNNILQKSIVY